MLRTIPGYSHLKRLSTTPQLPHSSAGKAPADDSLRAPIRIALDVACGMRPPTTLTTSHFDTQVRIHLRAYLKARRPRGPVALQHLDVRPAPRPRTEDPLAVRHVAAVEVVGTYAVAGKTQAFATRLELREGKRLWVMRSLRLF